MLRELSLALGLVTVVTGVAAQTPPPLPVEPVGVIESLPAQYPEDWFLVQDASFFQMSDGKVIVIDTSKDTIAEQVKGTFNVVLMGNVHQAPSRHEFYATETFHSRGTRGQRLDVLSIWDAATLAPKGEVILPTGKRFMGMQQRNAMRLLNNDKWLAIFNFSPATSVSLVDLDTRELIGEVAIPGCSFLYPAAGLGFNSLCADGRFLTTQLNEDGSVRQQVRGEKFFDSDESPIFERAAIIGDVGYFPSFDGLVYPVDFSGDVAAPKKPWRLAPEADGAWAASGIGIDGEDALGRIYFLVNGEAAGQDGAHNQGGSEIWVYEPTSGERVLRIPLQEWGLSFAVNRSKEPKVLVTNPVDMSVELYSGVDGRFIKKITGIGQSTPLYIQAAR